MNVDLHGVELRELKSERRRAMDLACDMIAELGATPGRILLHHCVNIEDEQGHVIERLYCRDDVSIAR